MLPTFTKIFIDIIYSPIRHPELLWILIPVYVNWIVGDIYQEHKGTHIGNAISNGFVALWVGLDWGRRLTQNFSFGSVSAIKVGLIGFLILYGLFILIEGIRGRNIAKYVGRVREVTYFIITFTPIFYEYVPFSMETLISIIIFFPIFYITVEIIMRLTPSPEDLISE
jgi:hypothetical protein